MTTATGDGDAAGASSPPRSLREIHRRANVQYVTMSQVAYSALREAILSGVLEPGQRLRQRDLAEELEVSRMPVRAALLQLESEGLVTFHPRRGAVVSRLTPEHLRQVYDLMIVVETYALREALGSGRVTGAKLARLTTLAGALDATHGGGDYLKLQEAFYRELYGAERNPVLSDVIERLRGEIGRYCRRVLHDHEHRHSQLLTYLRDGDADGAERWLHSHLDMVKEELAALLEKTRG